MPAQRPRASFEPIAPHFDLKSLVEKTPNFNYVDRINCSMIEEQPAAFEKLISVHVIVGGKPLVIEGYQDLLDPWTFTPKWLRDNCGGKVENARNLVSQENLPLTMAHYLRNMGLLTNRFFDHPEDYRDKGRQRMYLKDIDCPPVWWDKLREHIPSGLAYLNDNTGEIGGPGAVPEAHGNIPGHRLGKGVARAGDLMSSLPTDMRAENLMCYIGHEGTYTPAHREMCASLGHNIMVEASGTVSDDGQVEKPGSSIWFMTESKDRFLVSEYWLGVLGHDIEVEKHFAQVPAWKMAPFNVYVVEQRPGDLILIPPLAPHQVWNRGTRTMKIAWNRTTVETLEMALYEALPRSRIVCRDEQYKNKAIVYYTLLKYSSLLTISRQHASRMPPAAGHQFLYTGKIKQLIKDFKRLFGLYRHILLSEMFHPDDRDTKSLEYVPFDSNITCAYCRCNIFNRFLTCPNCKEQLGHNPVTGEGDPYDVCLDCYAMGRSCACLSGLKFVEQFKWKELTTKYEAWRLLIIALDGGQISDKTPLTLGEERARFPKKTLAEVCKEQLKRRPFHDPTKPIENLEKSDESEEEIVVGDDGLVKKVQKKRSKAWLKNNPTCHVCCHRHPAWKMTHCTQCDKAWCFGTLFRGWDKMPIEIMEDNAWTCPHCLGICFAGACKTGGKHTPYQPKGTLLGHDTKIVADVRSVEALVDFSVSNLNWLKDDNPEDKAKSNRLKFAKAEAEKSKDLDATLREYEEEENDNQDHPENPHEDSHIDPALAGNPDGLNSHSPYETSEAALAQKLQHATASLTNPTQENTGHAHQEIHNGYEPLSAAGYPSSVTGTYPMPDADDSYQYPASQAIAEDTLEPLTNEVLRPFKKRRVNGQVTADGDEIRMQKAPKPRKPRLIAVGFRSADLAETPSEVQAGQTRTEAQKQFEKEKERQRLEQAKASGRFIIMTAALKNKKRVVVLKAPGQLLAQLQSRQTAKPPLNADDSGDGLADAEHELEAPVPVADQVEEAPDDILKSDLVPKVEVKPKPAVRKQTQPSGLITGTRRAVIPVEKDDNYRQTRREPKGDKRRKSAPKAAASAPSSAANPRLHKTYTSNFDFEEIDIGSDDEREEDETLPVTRRDRRSLPGYLQNRHEEDATDMPNELPKNHRDHNPAAAKRNAARRRTQGSSPSAVHHKAQSSNLRDARTAGKPSAMRPAAVLFADPDSVEDGLDQIVDRFASGDGFNNMHPQGVLHASLASSRNRQKIDEQNRLAKLRALEGLELMELSTPNVVAHGVRKGIQGNRGAAASHAFTPVNISSGEDSSDASPDTVPAARMI